MEGTDVKDSWILRSVIVIFEHIRKDCFTIELGRIWENGRPMELDWVSVLIRTSSDTITPP